MWGSPWPELTAQSTSENENTHKGKSINVRNLVHLEMLRKYKIWKTLNKTINIRQGPERPQKKQSKYQLQENRSVAQEKGHELLKSHTWSSDYRPNHSRPRDHGGPAGTRREGHVS